MGGAVVGAKAFLLRRVTNVQAHAPAASAGLQTEPRAQRRQARQGLPRAQVVTAGQVQAATQVQRHARLLHAYPALHFEALQAGPHALKAVFGHQAGRVTRLARHGDVQTGGVQRNEVGKAGAEQVGLEAVGALLPGQAQLAMAAALQAQLWVTLFIGGRGQVHTIGVELVVSRCALGAAQAGRRLPTGAQAGAQPQRETAWRVTALHSVTKARCRSARFVTDGVNADLLGTRAQTQRQRFHRQLFQHKQGLRPRLCAGHKGLFAQG